MLPSLKAKVESEGESEAMWYTKLHAHAVKRVMLIMADDDIVDRNILRIFKITDICF